MRSSSSGCRDIRAFLAMNRLITLPDKRQLCRYLVQSPIPKCLAREAIKNWTEHQHFNTWKDIPGCRHGKLFIGKPYKKRADDLIFGRHQLKMVVAILTGHAPLKGHLHTMGLFNGDPSCRFCGRETETVQHITCCCESLARQRYNVFGDCLYNQKK